MIKVTAKRLGYYDHKRRRPGDKFLISSESEGSFDRQIEQELKDKDTGKPYKRTRRFRGWMVKGWGEVDTSEKVGGLPFAKMLKEGRKAEVNVDPDYSKPKDGKEEKETKKSKADVL